MTDNSRRQIFIFELDGEEYSIDIGSVREIIKSEEKEITEVPNVPDFISGITNVRGQVVPVIDLEEKFNLSHHENNYIVIVELNETPAGLLVDDVEEVLKVEKSKIQDAPKILEQEIHREYVKDVVVLEDRMIIILDLKAGLTEHEEIAVQELKDTMESGDEEEDEDEEVTKQDAKRAAMDRLDDGEEENSEEDSEEEESGDKSEEDESDEESGDSDEDKEEEESGEEDEEEFKCDECGDSFDSKRGLASHKVQKH